MAKLTGKTAQGTSFHDTVITTTLSKLIKILGEPQWYNNDGQGKTNVDFICETDFGNVFTIYDWKYYRPIKKNELIGFHIGGNNALITERAKTEL